MSSKVKIQFNNEDDGVSKIAAHLEQMEKEGVFNEEDLSDLQKLSIMK